MRAAILSTLTLLSIVPGAARAQSILSARAGTVHYTEGEVFLDDKALVSKFGEFPEVKQNMVFRTTVGRAEVLLGPGAILRIAENSSFRLVADRITDTRLELLAGSALLECAEILKGNRITIVTGGQSATIRKDGLYRFDFDPARLRVYDGEAELTAGGQTLVVKEGRQVALNGLLAAEKFDNKVGDTLYRWSKRRSGYLAVANLSAAKSIRDSGLGWGVSGWRYNPYFGFYTFIPASGIWHSPFGFLYYAPRTVYRVYEQPAVSRGYGAGGFGGPGGPRYNPNLGYDTMSRSSSGSYVGSSASAPVAAAPAPSPRAAESATPRESSGGGRGR